MSPTCKPMFTPIRSPAVTMTPLLGLTKTLCLYGYCVDTRFESRPDVFAGVIGWYGIRQTRSILDDDNSGVWHTRALSVRDGAGYGSKIALREYANSEYKRQKHATQS